MCGATLTLSPSSLSLCATPPRARAHARTRAEEIIRAQKSEMGPLGVPFQGASPGLPATQTEYGTVPMLPGAEYESSSWRSGWHSAFCRDRNRSTDRSS